LQGVLICTTINFVQIGTVLFNHYYNQTGQ
jgi:hypothetical protein